LDTYVSKTTSHDGLNRGSFRGALETVCFCLDIHSLNRLATIDIRYDIS